MCSTLGIGPAFFNFLGLSSCHSSSQRYSYPLLILIHRRSKTKFQKGRKRFCQFIFIGCLQIWMPFSKFPISIISRLLNMVLSCMEWIKVQRKTMWSYGRCCRFSTHMSETLTIGSEGGLFVTDDEFYYKQTGLLQYFVSVN